MEVVRKYKGPIGKGTGGSKAKITLKELILLHPEILVSEDSLNKLGNFAAYFDDQGRVRLSMGSRLYSRVLLHRAILPGHVYIDHKNNNKLDNRLENLRPCTHQQNMGNRRINKNNTSGYKGVTYSKIMKAWRARIYVNKKELNLGYYPTVEAAARAYDFAALMHYKEFALLNFPVEVNQNA